MKLILGMEMGLGPRHIVLHGDPAPLPKKGTEPPIFHPFLLSPNGWMHQDATWYGGRPRPSDFVFDGDPATPRTEGAPTTTQFLAHVYCGQTAGWMKTPLGTEVDLGPGPIVLDGIPALRETGTAAPLPFRSVSIMGTFAHLSYCWALVLVQPQQVCLCQWTTWW